MGPRFNGVEDMAQEDCDALGSRMASMGPRFNGVEDAAGEDELADIA